MDNNENEVKWVRRLRLAEESGGVMLSEMDCFELRQYLEALRLAVQRPSDKR